MTVVVGILGAREGLLKVIRQIREGETFLNGHCLFKGEGVDPVRFPNPLAFAKSGGPV